MLKAKIPQIAWFGLASMTTNAIWCGQLDQTVAKDLKRLDSYFEKALPGLCYLNGGRCIDGLLPENYTQALNTEVQYSTDGGMKKARSNLARVESWMAEYVRLITYKTIGFETSRSKKIKKMRNDRVMSWMKKVDPKFVKFVHHRCTEMKRPNACLANTLFKK